MHIILKFYYSKSKEYPVYLKENLIYSNDFIPYIFDMFKYKKDNQIVHTVSKSDPNNHRVEFDRTSQ